MAGKTCGSDECAKAYKESVNRLKHPTTKMQLISDIGITARVTKGGNTKSEHMVIVKCGICEQHTTITISEASTQVSCGHKECIAKARTIKAGNGGATKTHGMSTTKLYNVWQAMIKRCSPVNANNALYKSYAGKGIIVCNKWLTYEGFYNDMGKGYEEFIRGADSSSAPSIDRIDSNGNYELSNCQWLSHGKNSSKDRKEAIVQFTMAGEYIAEFTDTYHAATTGVGCEGKPIISTKVNAVTLGRRKTHAGCVWKKLVDCTPKEISRVAPSNWMTYSSGPVKRNVVGFPVRQLTMDGVEVCVFDDANDAEDGTGVKRAGIGMVCRGQRNSAGGFRWAYTM